MKVRNRMTLTFFMSLLFLILLSPPLFSEGDFINVNSAAQENPAVDNGNCTLGEAIMAANTNVKVDQCAAGKAGEDIIYITSNLKSLVLNTSIVDQVNGLPKITEDLGINCNHSTISRKNDIDTPNFRIFEVAKGVVFQLSHCTIEGGRLPDNSGGGIFNFGTLKLRHVTLKNNYAQFGGGISDVGKSYILNSSITDNESTASGGGISKEGGSQLELINTTIANNKATVKPGTGGGIYFFSGDIIADHVTITGNYAKKSGGGIYSFSPDGGVIDLRNSIVAGNTATDGSNDCNGIINKSNGKNIFKDISLCTFSDGTKNIVADPLLDQIAKKSFPPQLFGGMEMSGGIYFPLKSLSPAIDTAGDSSYPEETSLDQLLNPRVGSPDIGAVEAVCGDKVVQTEHGEGCDDGNFTPGDGCSELCKVEGDGEIPPVCGDGKVEVGENCDDGNKLDGDGCNSTCQIEGDGEIPPVCGNGKLELGEECDDGNVVAGDGCSPACKTEEGVKPACGDGILQAGEACDDGNLKDGDGCNSTCQIEVVMESPYCGNGVVDGKEECDDGNTNEEDGCSSTCVILDIVPEQKAKSGGGCSLVR